ncbi:hypothetical protein [Microbacterium lacticum]
MIPPTVPRRGSDAGYYGYQYRGSYYASTATPASGDPAPQGRGARRRAGDSI